jgi:hypothetical protein
MQVMVPTLDAETVSRALVFAVCLLALLVAHQVGDHVLQTDQQAAGKAGSIRAMAGHLLGYHLCFAAILLGTVGLLGVPVTGRGVIAGLAFSAATHAVLDLRWPVAAILRAARSPEFAKATTPVSGLYAADQALHKLALLISALLIALL